MKKIALLVTSLLFVFSCKSDDDTTPQPTPTADIDISFTQKWDGNEIVNSDYQTTTYVNASNNEITLSKLVYLISDVTLTATDGTVYDAGDYNLIDARNGTNATFTPGVEVPEGDYQLSFTFGFDNEDNDKADGYPDLNSADGGWGVPAPLGGGYHYMRLEGTFQNNAGDTESFQYHTVRANKHSSLPPGPGTLEELQDTSFVVSLGTITVGSSTNVEVIMNVDEWFKNPNLWDLNDNSTVMMPKFDLQIDMNQNGSNGVFSLGNVTQ